ncbi:bacterial general secretion pathway protein g-type pilin [Trichococcus palustris]|jgi:competence protein ComGC|uniref:Bacterial general secretion pathway protein g-type pilin n=1 Tax=Trichococcus palustris TaxID=140314 RepID=A0A143YCP2_9LACT|nr:competence type IV pilus major pilin ComGC [Trichococcus palustris]CZQ87521.1 bacterial general secretion pathway protein g-type pilin [Trichococcus palustris]SFK78687.1 competence protein ComGC [Trichococcus palustris]
MGKFMKKINNKRGFTLIEMVLVLFIISVLMLLIIPNLSGKKNAIEAQGNAALQTVVQAQADMYELDKGVEAGTFAELQADKYINQKQFTEATAKLVITAGEVSLK